MPSLSSSPIDWILLALFIAIVAMGLWAFYFWWKKNRYTRERFAFAGFASLSGITILFLAGLSLNASIPSIVLNIALQPFGFPPQISPPLSPWGAVLFTLVLVALAYVFLQVFKHWNGQKSLAQHEQEQNREAASILRDITLFLRRNREQLAPYREETGPQDNVLEKPGLLAWHERARQLWLLRNRSYLFDETYDPSRHCWLGEEKNTGALALLASYSEAPTSETLAELVEYARKVAKHREQNQLELIVALKNSATDQRKLE